MRQKEWEIENWGRGEMPRKWRGKGGKECENVRGGLCLERSGKGGKRRENSKR